MIRGRYISQYRNTYSYNIGRRQTSGTRQQTAQQLHMSLDKRGFGEAITQTRTYPRFVKRSNPALHGMHHRSGASDGVPPGQIEAGNNRKRVQSSCDNRLYPTWWKGRNMNTQWTRKVEPSCPMKQTTEIASRLVTGCTPLHRLYASQLVQHEVHQHTYEAHMSVHWHKVSTSAPGVSLAHCSTATCTKNYESHVSASLFAARNVCARYPVSPLQCMPCDMRHPFQQDCPHIGIHTPSASGPGPFSTSVRAASECAQSCQLCIRQESSPRSLGRCILS